MKEDYVSFFIVAIIVFALLSGCTNKKKSNNEENDNTQYYYYLFIRPEEPGNYHVILPLLYNENMKVDDDIKISEMYKTNIESIQIRKYLEDEYGIGFIGNGLEINFTNTFALYYTLTGDCRLTMDPYTPDIGPKPYFTFFDSNKNDSIMINIHGQSTNGFGFESEYIEITPGWNEIYLREWDFENGFDDYNTIK